MADFATLISNITPFHMTCYVRLVHNITHDGVSPKLDKKKYGLTDI